ncbi:MAG: PEP-CTERM sorting domain-containing protein [Deltaproteobacteria bacterium]|nr:PEP-CTERM sorting domain-containing protein [Deltaproteobacteria bacterium]
MKNFLKMLFLCVVLLTVASLFGGAASATIISDSLVIDFRTSDWAGANGRSVYTVGDVTVSAYDVHDPGWHAKLYQDEVDGLGVLGGQDDEIDRHEFIWVHIKGEMMINGVWITDLFDAPDGGDGEKGQMLFSDLGGSFYFFQFYGNDADQGNGEIWVDFGDEFLVSDAVFGSKPWPGYDGNEFSVAGFTAAAVPEPATMLLLGAGLIGLAGVGRRKFVKKT